MTSRTRNILKGAGSILDIAPRAKLRVIKGQSIEKRIERHWAQTGRYIQSSMNKFADEQKTKAK